MKIVFNVLMYVIVFTVAMSLSKFYGINEFILLPWSWLVVMVIRIYIGDFKTGKNKIVETSKLVGMASLISVLVYLYELYIW